MDEMIGEFVVETLESLAMLDHELVKLEQDPQGKAILSNIFRVMHTIKGTCGFLGLHRLEKVAHAGENILGKFRDGEIQVTPKAITLILRSIDCIKNIVETLAEAGAEPEGDDSTLITELNRFAEGGMSENAEPLPVAVDITTDSGQDLSCFFKGDDDLEELMRLEGVSVTDVHTGTPVHESTISISVAHKPNEEVKKPQETDNNHARETHKENTAQQSIRVNLDILEKMMQMVGELVLSRNQLMQLARDEANQQFLAPLQQLSHITTELQESVMKTRMQPIGAAWQKFPRLVRDLSLELGKKIDLKMIGEDTELDRQLLEAVKDPLTHMVRNSCDHGIETPEQRRATGKAESGTVTLNAYHDGGHIVIDISDDGKGINVERIKEKALANGLATQNELANMSQRQILQYIFAPGFSTAEKVTSVSGRGVGMDVVRTNIEKIGGTIDLFSNEGSGSRISIKIPLTLAIISVLIVEKNGESFAIPQINVRELIQVGEGFPIKIEYIDNAAVIRLRENLLPVASLSNILQLPEQEYAKQSRHNFIVVCNVGGVDFGLIVDRVHNIEEIVVKPVSQALKSISIFGGNTILGDGNVIMILDPNSLAREVTEMKRSSQNHEVQEHMNSTMDKQEKTTNFLLFRLGDGVPRAVPLELVWRLEEIDASDIESAGGQMAVQYRGELMRLLSLDSDFSSPSDGIINVIVFSCDGKTIGLPVSEIVDIVQSPFKLQLSSEKAGYLGSMIMNGQTVDMVDVSYLLNSVQLPESTDTQPCSGRVLLVDDSPFYLKLAAPYLTSVGYEVATAESAQEALNLLERSNGAFDIIITDIHMPEMDGYAFAESCRNSRTFNNIPIIGCTATLDQETIARSSQAGMLTCVSKNNRPRLLEAMSGTCARMVA